MKKEAIEKIIAITFCMIFIILMMHESRAQSAASAAAPDCPNSTSAQETTTWRDSALQQGERSLVSRVEQCFPQNIPACLQRPYKSSRANTNQYSDSTSNMESATDQKFRLPPDEFLAPGSSPGPGAKYQLFQGDRDVEQIAQSKGWPMVRYKSRHAGGFDEDTASLLMIRVPGATLNPPADYDQYINISLPADPADTNTHLASADVQSVPTQRIPSQHDYESHGDRLPTIMTIVTVEKKHGDQPARVFFSKFDRSGNSPTFVAEPPQAVLSNCYSCHPNGLREISPLGYDINQSQQAHGQVKPDPMWQAAQEMNATMGLNSGYSMVSWGNVKDPTTGKVRPIVDPEGYGPVWGPVRPLNHHVSQDASGHQTITYPTRTQAFIMGDGTQPGCAKSRPWISVADIFGRAAGRDNKFVMTDSPPIDWNKVKNAMNCASCHNNQNRGALNSHTDKSQIEFKILVDQSMPMGAHLNPLNQGSNSSTPVHDDLNPNERIALYNCLEKEFDQESGLKDVWTKEVACKDESNIMSPNGSVYPTTALPPGAVSDQSRGFQPATTGGAQPAAVPVAAPIAAPATH